MSPIHPSLAAGRWKTFSLAEQLANVGSEVHRAATYRDQMNADPARKTELEERTERALDRALELLDLTRVYAVRPAVRKELGRVRELLAAAYLNDMRYVTTLRDLEPYFDAFAVYANKEKI